MLKPHMLEDENGLLELQELSKNPEIQGVFVFKHSTRCSVSYMAYKGLKAMWKFDDIPFYYLDLIKFRDISNEVASVFNLKHESPQLLFINNGECTNSATHFNVNVDTIQKWLNA
jgi:bacillithiol system protein YtxJ